MQEELSDFQRFLPSPDYPLECAPEELAGWLLEWFRSQSAPENVMNWDVINGDYNLHFLS